jgi:hypothetical protein
MASLLEEGAAPVALPAALERLERRLPSTRALALALAVAAAALAVSVAGLFVVRAGAREQLAQHALTLRAPTEIRRSQEAVLRGIAAERQPLLPIIEAIHKAAPPGLLLESLIVGAGGELQLNCTTKDRSQADALFRELSASPLLSDVKLPVVKPDRKGISFQMTAQIRARQTKARR